MHEGKTKPESSLMTLLIHIEEAVDRINHKWEALMATVQNFKDLVTALNDATNTIAARIEALIAKLNDTGISAAEEDAALAGLQTAADNLKTLGQNPADPVPTV